jgi:hypothetical protein
MNPFHKTQSLSGDISRSSALSPLLWPCLEISCPCFGGAFLLKDGWLAYILIFIGFLPVIYAIRCYTYFMKVDPDALRSEKYNIEIKKMELLGSKDKLLEIGEEAIKNPNLIEGAKEKSNE